MSRSTPAGNTDQILSYLPGEPSISLALPNVTHFLSSELSTPVLDELYNHLWLVARKSGRSIDPLHRQKIKGRAILATEDPRLHLVWHHDRIYIKPMPLYLLNYDVWNTFLSTPAHDGGIKQVHSEVPRSRCIPAFDRAVAVGFMRSYSQLVRHRVDFILAHESHLFPAEIDWIKWSEFIAHFRNFEDGDVAKRYHYGQLRLSRLDWAVRLFRPASTATRWFYEIPHWSTSIYVEQAIAPLLFGFASLSLVLSSMQVILSVPDEGLEHYNLDSASLVYMKQAFWVFSIIVLLLSGAIWIMLFVIPFSVLLWQLSWGFTNRHKPCPKAVLQPGQRPNHDV